MVVKVDDTVMAYHGVMIYDAKVLKIDHGQGVQSDKSSTKGTGASMYYVHYQGWHKKWDEWIAHDRVLEDTPANRELQKQAKVAFDTMKKAKSAMAKKKKISTSGIDPSASKKSPFKRMKRNAENDTEELPMDAQDESERVGHGPPVKQVSIQMPFSLKKQLVEDWKHVTHEPYRLVTLPRKPTVSQIIKNYLEFKKSKLKEGEPADDKEYKNLESIMDGIQSYFDRALGSILLYRMERKQYHDIKLKHPDTQLSDIYGAEHLIRLFGTAFYEVFPIVLPPLILFFSSFLFTMI